MEAGSEVNFMIFDSTAEAVDRALSIVVDR